MKSVVVTDTNQEIHFADKDLPVLIHGKEGSGASFFSITIAAQFHVAEKKLLAYTAYPMAKEEFFEQVGELSKNVFYLESIEQLSMASAFQTIWVESGNQKLLLAVLEELSDLSERILFIKNVETVHEYDCVAYALRNPSIISGDVETSEFQEEITHAQYASKILFSPLGNSLLPKLEKYQAFASGSLGEYIVCLR